jgi:16S rRNA (cytosine1402-N4)-methyltransferase
MTQARHVPVLMDSVLGALDPRRFEGRPSLWLDGTLGLAGHAKAILEAAGDQARLLGTDRDEQALALARQALQPFGTRIRLMHKSFAEVVDDDRLALDPESKGFDGILLDLGVSSLQLDSPERGFSFQREGPLDMRMDAGHGDGAGDWLAHADAAALERVLRDYGEERQARRMASAVLRARDLGELRNTLDLARVAERVLGRPRPGQIHPATRLFQALRLAVNGELEALEHALPRLRGMLAQGGRLAVISFHSLEDRLVKDDFRRESRDCICPPGLPECRCGHKASVRELSRKPMEAGEAETAGNPRSRSAKLRVIEKL